MLSENIEIPVSNKKHVQIWKCHREWKSLSTHDIYIILAFNQLFDKPFRKVHKHLHFCDDDCSSVQVNTTKVTSNDSQGLPYYTLSGHPLSCYVENSNCFSKLRILRAASIHYPLLRIF